MKASEKTDAPKPKIAASIVSHQSKRAKTVTPQVVETVQKGKNEESKATRIAENPFLQAVVANRRDIKRLEKELEIAYELHAKLY